jgi:hypothetical protein
MPLGRGTEERMFKSNLVAGIIGIVLVAGFLGTLGWWLKSVPLTIIILGVLGLIVYDVVKALREVNGNAG